MQCDPALTLRPLARRYGHSPLDDAVRFNHHAVIELLVQTGAHLNVAPAKLGMLLCKSVSLPALLSMSKENAPSAHKVPIASVL